jgi:glyoxylase-like metal-dependent hydrolase (beta-lactamase superfamily II)
MTEVTPGIHWLKLPIGMEDSTLTHINVYLIKGTGGFLLVDSGWNTDESFSTLKNGLAEIGADFKDISQIVITHVHPDHYGMAGRIKKLSGATIAMHHIEKEFIQPRYVSMEELLHQTDRMLVANGVPHDEMTELRDATVGLEQYTVPTPPDKTLHGGETISTGMFTFRVVWTPGHSSVSMNPKEKSCSPATISCPKSHPISACTRSLSKIPSAGICSRSRKSSSWTSRSPCPAMISPLLGSDRASMR